MAGAIPESALDQGWKLARSNALQFLSDAELLLKHGSPGHAVALANYALEEYGKMGMLRAMRLDPRLHTVENEKSAMRDHGFKVSVLFKGLTAPGPVPDELQKEIIEFGQKVQSTKEARIIRRLSRQMANPALRGPLPECRPDSLIRQTTD